MILEYGGILKAVKKAKGSLLLKFKIKTLIGAAKSLKKLVKHLIRFSKFPGAKKAARKMRAIKMLVKSFSSVIISLLLLAPLAAIFLILSPILILLFAAFALVFKIIIMILARVISIQTVAVIVLLIGLVWLLVLLGVGLLLLGVIAMGIMMVWKDILLFLGVLLLVIAGIAIIGFLISFVAPLILAAAIGLILVAIAVFCILAIAAMLWLLQFIKLDPEKIKENVRIVINTAMDIFMMLFEDTLEDPKKKESGFMHLIRLIGGAIEKIIMALAAATILIFTVVSVVCILLIAAMLWLLQNIKLNPAKIRENVALVIDIARSIID